MYTILMVTERWKLHSLWGIKKGFLKKARSCTDRRLREAKRSLRGEALAGAPPVLRREPGHKEPSALAPQNGGPE